MILNSSKAVYHLAKAGYLADFTEFFENDKNFNVSDYNEAVLYSGQYEGKQYSLPVGCNVSSILTTQKNIDNGVVDVSKMDNYANTIKEITSILEKNKGDDGMMEPILSHSLLSMYPQISGVDFIDYSNATANIDNDDMRMVSTTYKEISDLIKSLCMMEMKRMMV